MRHSCVAGLALALALTGCEPYALTFVPDRDGGTADLEPDAAADSFPTDEPADDAAAPDVWQPPEPHEASVADPSPEPATELEPEAGPDVGEDAAQDSPPDATDAAAEREPVQCPPGLYDCAGDGRCATVAGDLACGGCGLACPPGEWCDQVGANLWRCHP